MPTTYTVEDNINLVYFTLHKHFSRWINDDDVVQSATIGLWNACRTYDSEKGAFSTYAVTCIRYEVIRHLRTLKPATELSLNTTITTDYGSIEHLHSIADPATPMDSVLNNMVFEQLHQKLKPRQKQIVDLLLEGKNGRAIAKELGISHQHVYQTISEIKEKLKKMLGEST